MQKKYFFSILSFLCFISTHLSASSELYELYLAASVGDILKVNALIEKGADINKGIAIDKADGRTPLFVAAEKGHLNVVKALINSGAEINKETVAGRTPLFVAAEKGHLNVVKALINSGAEINKETVEGWTPLCIAVAYGHLNVVKALINSGAEINKETVAGWTPLRIAVALGHLNVVKALEAAVKQSVAPVSFENLVVMGVGIALGAISFVLAQTIHPAQRRVYGEDLLQVLL